MVVDDRDLVGIREHPGALVGEHGFRRHAAPQLVADLHVFVGKVVALVMSELLLSERTVLGATMARADVPPHSATREVVERRDPPYCQVWRGAGRGQGDTEAEML